MEKFISKLNFLILHYKVSNSHTMLARQVQRRNLRLIPKMPKFMPTRESFRLKDDAPGGIIGTVNDAYVPPEYCPPEGSFHWAYEKITNVAMIPAMIAMPVLGGAEYPILDAVMSSLVLIHARMGLQSCIEDYIPLRRFQNWHKLAKLLLSGGTLVSLYGVYQLETVDNGVTALIVDLWNA